ncbi:MAG: WG repeat-containing protein [Clostridia bacterium]|nr:WG repeat-containing protein [Clostridia bacterium]
MKKLLACLLMLCLLLCAAAAAEIQVETVMVDNMIFLSRETNCYYQRVDGGYQIFDREGNALSKVYKGITAKGNGDYYEYYNETKSLNYIGILNSRGEEITAPMYGVFYSFDDGWGMGYVLQAVSGDSGDFKDSDNKWYNATRCDLFCDGRIIGTLNRDEYLPTYTEGSAGNYFYVKESSEKGYFLDKNMNKYVVNGYLSASSEYEYDYKTKSVTHVPTQQKAFCPECTLTAEDVKCPIWYDDNTGNVLDLQGNVIKSGLVFEYSYRHEGGIRVKRNGSYGIMDFEGNVIAEPIYSDVAASYGMFPQGYQAALTKEGYLHYLDRQGNITAKAEYALTSSDYKGYTNNAVFACVKNMGKVIVITATSGELAEKYDDYGTPGTHHPILRVQKNGLWGAIDTYGNTVIPFIHRSSPEISDDGTLVFAQNENREYLIYCLNYTDAAVTAQPAEQPAEDAPAAPAADGAWTCSCGAQCTGKFCGECGAKKPEPTPAPAADGAWDCTCGSHNTGKFCPECGAKRPEVPVEVKCSSCGYKPEGETPKFCPECGTKF